jgi:hypothetical protein
MLTTKVHPFALHFLAVLILIFFFLLRQNAKDQGQGHEEDKQSAERGAEQLVEHLNIYFARIIAIIQQWGGDIVKFAGDAMLCVFYANAADFEKEAMRGVCSRMKKKVAPMSFQTICFLCRLSTKQCDVLFNCTKSKKARELLILSN